MAIFSTSSHAVPTDGTARPHHPQSTLIDRALVALETWIAMRTRRERPRLDAAIERASHPAAPDSRARSDWWRSWRACTRRRDGQR